MGYFIFSSSIVISLIQYFSSEVGGAGVEEGKNVSWLWNEREKTLRKWKFDMIFTSLFLLNEQKGIGIAYPGAFSEAL